jgi:hypothetical protein
MGRNKVKPEQASKVHMATDVEVLASVKLHLQQWARASAAPRAPREQLVH